MQRQCIAISNYLFNSSIPQKSDFQLFDLMNQLLYIYRTLHNSSMDSFNFELYRLAGYSKKSGLPPTLLTDIHIPENKNTEISSGYSCVFNWASMCYEFISESIKSILGYDRSLFFEKGFNFSISIIHPADMQKLREIHTVIFSYYYNTPPRQRTGLRFSYNFRVKTAHSSYIYLLRQSTFASLTDDGKPTLEYINSTDITGFRYNEHITLTVHRLSEAGIYVLCYEQDFSDIHPALSEREKQVFKLVKQGFTTKEIAEKLYLSIETVKSHRKNIIAKTGAVKMTAAISMINDSF